MDSWRDQVKPGGADPAWPDDFSPEEIRFARKLRGVYSIEDENLPPLYVQTMLEDVSRAPLSPGYTRTLTYRVMRRLELPRRPLAPRRRKPRLPDRASLRAFSEPVRRAGAPAIAALAVLMTLVLGSMYLATPSFAQGLRILLGQTGAQQMDTYPTIAEPTKPRTAGHRNGGARAEAMPVYWPGPAIDGYSYLGMNLIDQQDWSRGPVLELQYSLTQPVNDKAATPTPAATTIGKDSAATTAGSGLLDIREFQVSSQYSAVLLAVQTGSVTMTTANGQPAVYVDGMWTLTPGGRKVWQTGARSMLMFEADGIIFWITGDQRDGLDAYALTQIAASLTQTTVATLRPNRLSARFGATDPDLRAPLGANTDAVDAIPHGVDPADITAGGKFYTLNPPAPTLIN